MSMLGPRRARDDDGGRGPRQLKHLVQGSGGESAVHEGDATGSAALYDVEMGACPTVGA